MMVPPPLFELVVAELGLAGAVRGQQFRPTQYAKVWQRFGRGAREAVACDRVFSSALESLFIPTAPVVPADDVPRKRRRGPTSAKARRRQKIKQHNRRVTSSRAS